MEPELIKKRAALELLGLLCGTASELPDQTKGKLLGLVEKTLPGGDCETYIRHLRENLGSLTTVLDGQLTCKDAVLLITTMYECTLALPGQGKQEYRSIFERRLTVINNPQVANWGHRFVVWLRR